MTCYWLLYTLSLSAGKKMKTREMSRLFPSGTKDGGTGPEGPPASKATTSLLVTL